jgi:hypothetical protein
MKSSRFARVLSAILIAISACVVLPLDAATPQLKLQRQNELFLARLQPGHDTLASAEKLFTGQLQKSPASTTENAKWTDACTGRTVTLDANAAGVIQTVNLDFEAKLRPACTPEMYAASQREPFWQTGHGMKLGDTRARVVETYGQPASTGPSVKGARELELLYYAFDWAGSNVPQVMEVSCERATGRVVEILLAFPSL